MTMWKLLCSIILLLLLSIVIIDYFHDGSEGTEPASQTEHDFTFENDGETVYVSNGKAYDKNGKHLADLYDPNHFNEHYVEEDGTLYLVHDGTRYATTTELTTDFEYDALADIMASEERWEQYMWNSYTTNPEFSGKKDNYHDVGNTIELAQDPTGRENRVLKTTAKATGKVSKASVKRELFYFPEGSEIYFEGWFYIEGEDIYDGGGTTILDIESNWALGSPGIRLIFKDGDALAYEVKGMQKTYRQESPVEFPSKEWVHVKGRILVSSDNGEMQLWQNDQLVLDTEGQTLPYPGTFLNTVEVGTTAISKYAKNDQTIYVDDFTISGSPSEIF
ncbi:MAG: hypothetical protein OXR66_08295 [Candidatus Woesearchaeota archaeon]|nr:hypothetical protein [Candidatus Woesearchaeota archaeon]